MHDLSARGAEEIRTAVYDLAVGDMRSNGLVEELRETVTAFDSTSDLRVDLVVAGE